VISLFCCDFILFLLLPSYIIDCTVFIYSAINNVCVYVYVHLSHIPRNKAYLLTYLLTHLLVKLLQLQVGQVRLRVPKGS